MSSWMEGATSIEILSPETDVYTQIKGLEDLFPVPTPSATVEVGTLDIAAQQFDGMVSEILPQPHPSAFSDYTENYFPPSIEGVGIPIHSPSIPDYLKNPWSMFSDFPKIAPTPSPPSVEVAAVNVTLLFHIRNHFGDVTVTANGTTVEKNVTVTDRDLAIDIGAASFVNWTITVGGFSFSERLRITRPPILVAGAFLVPVFPFLIIYEPPPDPANQNQATYSVSNSKGTTVSASFFHEESKTVSGKSRFRDITAVQEALKAYALGITAVALANPAIKVFADAANHIANALGSAKATSTTGTKVTSDQRLTTDVLNKKSISTPVPNSGGPGIGDIIAYLKDVELMWVVEKGQINLTILNWSMIGLEEVSRLQSEIDDNANGLTRESVEALLALDPFVAGGTGAALPADRFIEHETYFLNGPVLEDLLEYTVTSSDRQGSAEFQIQIDELRKGFLSFLGIGVTENSTTKITTIHSTSIEQTSGERATASVRFYSAADKPYAVTVYFDRAFGTFAFREYPLGNAATVSGVVRDLNDLPFSREFVTLAVGGKKYKTITNDKGEYLFRPEVGSGQAQIMAGDVEEIVVLGKEPTTRDLRLPLRRIMAKDTGAKSRQK